jgi:hypothetical protein
MTAPNVPPNPNETTPAPSLSAPPTGAAEPYRAPAHSRFAGRTAEEILGIAEGLATVAERFNQPVQQQQQAPAPNRFDLDLPRVADDEYVSGAQFNETIRRFQNMPAPVDQQARNLAAQSIYAAVQLQHPEEFKRWKPEIDAEIRKLPPEYWTNDNLHVIVKMVRANHIDELAAEKAQRLLSESHPTIRSGTGGSGSGPLTHTRTLADDSLPQDWVKRANAAGITEEIVREFCNLTGQTPEQYLADVERYGKNAGVIRG